jgi:RimJ/RimL family protein N-acetyltransferase
MPAENLTLIPYVPKHLAALVESKQAYEKCSGSAVADGVRELLLAASPDFLVQIREANVPDPWRFGFAIMDKIDNMLIGLCGFTGPPNADGVVEMAYGIAPGYRGKGYATEAARALVKFASRDKRVRTICAHTLAETNASTRILEKCGFTRIAEFLDPENLRVWKWERTPLPTLK